MSVVLAVVPRWGGKMADVIDLIRSIPDRELGKALAPLLTKIAAHHRIVGRSGKPVGNDSLIAEGCKILRGLIVRHTGEVVDDEQLVPYVQILFKDRA